MKISIPRESRMALAALGLMIFAVAVFYWPLWSPNKSDRMYFEGDILEKDYPARAAWVQILRQGRFPFWNPYEFGGWPALANCEAGILYPLNWLLVPLAPVGYGHLTFYHVEALVLLHFILGGWFLYLLARRYGLQFWPAFLAALIYAFSGFHGGHKLHVSMFCTLVWLPLILYFVENALESRRLYHFLWAALFLGIAFLGGHPQMAYYICLILFLRLLWQLPRDHEYTGDWNCAWLDLLTRCCILFLPAAGLAAVQIAPAVELIGHSVRSGPGSYEFATQYSLPPQELVEFFLPQTLDAYYIEVFYAGLWSWLLAWAGLRRGVRSPARGFWILIFAFALLLSLGSYSGLFSSLYALVPGMGRVRAPSRWIYFADMALAIMAGFGLQGLLAWGKNSLRLAGRVRQLSRWIITGGAAGLAYLYTQTLMPYPRVHLENLHRLAGAVVLALVFLGLGWLLLGLFSNRRLSRIPLAVGFCALIFIDLASYNNRINVVDEIDHYEGSQVTAALRKAALNRSRYIQTTEDHHVANGNYFGLEEAGGRSPLAPEKYMEALNQAGDNANFLNLLGVEFFAGPPPEGLKSTCKPWGDNLWRLPGAYPRAFRVDDSVVIRDPDVRQELLESEGWDFGRMAWQDEKIAAIEFQPAPIGTLEEKFKQPVVVFSGSKNGSLMGAYIILGGRQVCRNERGYNLAVIDPGSGDLISTATFDTHWFGEEASSRMAAFIEEIPDGRLVVGAISDEGTQHLTEQGVAALESVGCALKLSGQFRMAHAFIGIKGFPPGTALEAADEREAILALGQRGQRFTVMRASDEKVEPLAVPLEQWQPGRLVLNTKKTPPGFLVITEKDYPGWRARLKQDAVRPVQANTLFMGLPLYQGTPAVELVFQPTGWYIWLAVSLLSLAVIAGGLILNRKRKRPVPEVARPSGKQILMQDESE